MSNPGMRLGPSCLHVVSWTSGRLWRHCADARDRDIDHDQAGNNNPIADFDENIGAASGRIYVDFEALVEELRAYGDAGY